MQGGIERGGLTQLEGIVEHVIYTNEQNGYTICDLSVDDEEIYTVVGIMPMVADGDRLTVWGRWVHNAKYGRQFSVVQYERVMPADTTSILRYLASRTIKGVGPKTAQRIVEEFGEDTFEVIEKHPEWLANIKGISSKLAHSISENFKEQSEVRSTMMFFQEYFGVATILKIYKRFGGRAVEIAKQNPYRLCNEVEGIGFDSADEMAGKLGFTTNNFDRIMSGVDHVLSRSSISGGHVCLPREELVNAASSLLGVSTDEVSSGIDELLRMEKLIGRESDGKQLIYQRQSFEDEKYIAKKLRVIDRMCTSISACDVDRFISGEEQKSGIRYASLQKKAIEDALRYGVMVLTGGPGTGKTTIVRALIPWALTLLLPRLREERQSDSRRRRVTRQRPYTDSLRCHSIPQESTFFSEIRIICLTSR